jgi:hypothetical protein
MTTSPTYSARDIVDSRDYIEVRNELDHDVRVNIVRTKTRGQIYVYIDKPIEGELIEHDNYATIPVKESDY